MSRQQSTKPRKARTPSNLTVDEYFWLHVDKNGPIPEHKPELGPCWLWLGNITKAGYGRIVYKGISVLAHVYAYELLVGPAPTNDLKNIQRDHICKNKSCPNPEHLEQVTRRENILRGDSPTAKNARKELCEKGHEMLGIRKTGAQAGTRYCLVCNLERAQQVYEKKKAAGMYAGESPTAINAAKTHCVRGHLITGTKKNGNRYCVVCNREDSHTRYQRLKAAKGR